MKKNYSKKRSGFTLIELLVAATIIIVLSAIALTSFRVTSRNARNGKRKADMETVRQALILYRTDNAGYPVGTNFNSMLLSIGQYIASENVKDPSGTAPYVYSYTSNGASFTLTSYLEPTTTGGTAQAYTLSSP